jgi:hypothetical protein
MPIADVVWWMVVELGSLGLIEDAGKCNPPWHHLVNEPAEVDLDPVSNKQHIENEC